jgi:hypothetical protein
VGERQAGQRRGLGGRPAHRAKRWDKDGKLISDDEFEADGSRKIKP